MKKLKSRIQDKYNLSNYQIAQLSFVYKSLSSEISKIIIMGILFHNHLDLYTFLLFVMCLLRTFSGGLHFYTYIRCLAASTIYI